MDRLDRLLALAWRRKLDELAPMDPDDFAKLPPLTADEVADFASRNERLISRIRVGCKRSRGPDQWS